MLFSLLLAIPILAVDPSAPDPNAVTVQCSTSKGNFTLAIHPSWSPKGAARFLELVDSDFYNRVPLYRVVPQFLVQFGIPFNPVPPTRWPAITDDPNQGIFFKRGMLSFAGSGANTRSTQTFIAFEDSPSLGHSPWETPFGMVTQGMNVVDSFYSGYGDLTAFGGSAPDPTRMSTSGCQYLLTQYPKLDYITSCHRKGGAHAAPALAHSAPAAPVAKPALYLPACTSGFCGSGIGVSEHPGAAICLCHHNCMVGLSSLPCCPGMQQACPTEYALGGAPAAPAVPQQPQQPQSGKSKKKKNHN